jgi:hypothetical protein
MRPFFMGCFASLCDDALKNEQGQFDALVVPATSIAPIMAPDSDTGAIPLFAPAPSDDENVVISSDSDAEQKSTPS